MKLGKKLKNISPGARVGMKIGDVDLKIPGGAITIVVGPTGHGKTLSLINMTLNYLSIHPDKQAFFFSYSRRVGQLFFSLFLNTYINDRHFNEQ